MKLENHHASLCVQKLGAMLHECRFHLPDGRTVQPLYDAPWRSCVDPDYASSDPLVSNLGSEWPCVPFGRPESGVPELPEEWVPSDNGAWDEWAHGYASNHDWELEKVSADHLIARLIYPDTSPVRQLVRHVRLMKDRPGIALSLEVHARKAVSFPLGLHPVLSMEGIAPESMDLTVADDARAWTFPVDVEEGRSFFAPNQQNMALDSLKTSSGGIFNVRHLPPDGQTEDLIMLTESGGRISVSNPAQKCRTTLEWDPAQLPGCLLWISNGGRDYYPWNGRTAALGVEPIASVFDLGRAYSLSEDTPLAAHGIKTSTFASPDAPLMCDYSISVDPA
ncbi:hypothetical protein [uncultured Cohaesibacter sp.]|uniref:hypothetical protein n=1 Tax=uncultured Cohaesibacter sp. TaxID=1002546 RepID=UPI0029C875D7|nr:hypothetical protein [uncultured Cohaesibacter sp.]